MRIAVHDYAGHAFTSELSRELASRGHDVLYLYCPDVVGGRGAVAVRADDPPSLVIQAATIGRTFEKYSRRRRFVYWCADGGHGRGEVRLRPGLLEESFEERPQWSGSAIETRRTASSDRKLAVGPLRAHRST